MLLTVEYEGVRWTSDLRLFYRLDVRLLDSGNDEFVASDKVRWCNLEDATDVVLKG